MHAAPSSVLEKWHGAGNDFLVALRRGAHAPLLAEQARRWCDRRTGVGADGLIDAELADGALAMRLFNADGSAAELSGNGLRCLAAAAAANGLVAEGALEVATGAGPRRVTVALDPGGDRAWASVEMGPVLVEAAGSLASGVAAQIGNPHVVIEDPGAPEDQLVALAAPIAAAAPAGANVEFVVVESRDRMRLRVVERGAGLTLACGTGSCAAAGVARRLGLVGDRVTVANPGGDLDVAFDGDVATLSGPAVRVASIVLAERW